MVLLDAAEQRGPDYLGTADKPGGLAENLHSAAEFLVGQGKLDEAPALATYQHGLNVAALTASFDYGSALLKEFSDQQLTERIASMPFLGPSASRLKVIYFSMQHTNDIYGQLVVYLRMNGVTPPASNRA